MPLTVQKLVSRLSLRQLQVFFAVYELGGYKRAADLLGLTQPAVSSQVRQLEAVFGEPLFEYLGRKLYCTAAGELVADAARHIFEQLKTLQADVHALKGRLSGELRLAAVSTAQYVLPYVLQPFVRDNPEVAPVIRVMNRAQAIERLQDNRDDFVVMGLVPPEKPLSSMPFLDNELIPVAISDHPLARAQTITPQEFFSQPQLIREAGSGSRLAVERFCQEARVRLEPYMEVGSNDALKHSVMAGMGLAVLPRLSILPELRLGLLRELPVTGFPIRRSWCLVYPRGKQLSPVARAFHDLIQLRLGDIRAHFNDLQRPATGN